MKGRIVIFIILLSAFAYAQHGERQYYQIPDFNGGINVQSDSANLQPNQALVMENFIFSSYGALKKRNSYSYWNRVPFPIGDTVKDFHHLYRTKGSNQLLIGTNNYIYASPFTDTVTVDASWSNVRIGYNKGTVDAYDDSNLIYGTDTWWLLAIKIGDSLEIDNDSMFAIDSIIADTCIQLDRNYQSAGNHDTIGSSYQIYRTIVGDPYITSWNSNGYIADSKSPAFYYADSQCYWLNCVDSGTIDSFFTSASASIDVDTVVTARYYSNGDLSRVVQIKGNMADTIGAIVEDEGVTCLVKHEYEGQELTRTFIRHLGSNHVLWITDYGSSDPGWTREEELDARIWTPIDIGNSVAISDTSKAWQTDEFTGYFLARGVRPDSLFTILWNSSDQIGVGRGDSAEVYVDTMFNSPYRYYIFEAIPYGDHPDTVASPYFNQIMFHKNILFASGYNIDKNGDTTNQGFVYHSDIGLPKKWSSFEGFDLSLNAQDKTIAFFKLHDDLIMSTNNSIYKLMGWPPAIGGGALVEALYGTGIDSYNSVVNRNNKKAYLARKDGFYIFDGNTPNKISLLIDPLIDKYRTSDYELGYFDENVYFSFIDSNKTFVYHEPTGTFTSLDFGMSVFDRQATLVDSTYFLFSHPSIIGSDSSYGRHIFKYPYSGYSDTPDTLGASAIAIKYKTGWMDLGSPNIKKQFDKFYLNTVKRSDTLTVRFRVDFDTTTHTSIGIADSVSLMYSYRFMNILDLPSTLQGRYLQIEITGNSGQEHTIGKWGVEYHAISKD